MQQVWLPSSDDQSDGEKVKEEGELKNHLYWELSRSCENQWDAHATKDDEYLGYLILERVGAHMHWCWAQEPCVYMSPGCLEEVRTKQKELFTNRKRK